MKANDPAKRRSECLRIAGDMLTILQADPLTEDVWRSLAASARQMERRAAEQYKLAEIDNARRLLDAYLAREGGA